jgi:hypothetical protein
LYERYAELLPDGPARARAAATARSVAAMLGPIDEVSIASALAADVGMADHRLLGFGSARGAKYFLGGLRSLLDTTNDPAQRVDDVLGLRSDALLVRRTNSGTHRTGGGAFETQLIQLWIFGAEGLLTREERFDADRDEEALTRFDELTAEPAAAPIAAAPSRAAKGRERRVRENAATAIAARLDAAIVARDSDALPTLLADDLEATEHATGATYDRLGNLATWRALLSAREPVSRHEPLATLGDSLALFRESMSGSGFAGRKFDVGAYEIENIVLFEVDAQGRNRRAEAFANDRLGDAVVRLYERHADLLPDGPARARAAATARSVAALLGPPDRWPFAPDVERADHRTLGLGSVHGAEAVLRGMRAFFELTEDFATRLDDILSLRSDALLVRWTHSGTDRASGGAFERRLCHLWVFGVDGLIARWEQFDAEREEEALARFDEVTAGPATVQFATAVEERRRRERPNAATANAARLAAVVAARDADALPSLLADDVEVIDHSKGVTFDRKGFLATLRTLLAARDPMLRDEPLATLGDALALCRFSTSASGFAGRRFDVGAYESEEIDLIEVDPQGRGRRFELFAADRLGDAVARLYERYADLLPAGPARERAAATARSLEALGGPPDVDRRATAFAPDIEYVDHRTVGLGSVHGAEAVLRGMRAFFELTEDLAARVDDILGQRSDALLLRRTDSGTDRAGGGAYERQILVLLSSEPMVS